MRASPSAGNSCGHRLVKSSHRVISAGDHRPVLFTNTLILFLEFCIKETIWTQHGTHQAIMQFQQRMEEQSGVYWAIMAVNEAARHSGVHEHRVVCCLTRRAPGGAPCPGPPAHSAAGQTIPHEGRAPRRHRDLVSTSSLQQTGRQAHTYRQGRGRCVSRCGWAGRHVGRWAGR